jgi:hypothetical protein
MHERRKTARASAAIFVALTTVTLSATPAQPASTAVLAVSVTVQPSCIVAGDPLPRATLVINCSRGVVLPAITGDLVVLTPTTHGFAIEPMGSASEAGSVIINF